MAVPSEMNARFKSVGSDELAALAVYNSPSKTNLVRATIATVVWVSRKSGNTVAQYWLKHTIH